jgi:hypothetical protein
VLSGAVRETREVMVYSVGWELGRGFYVWLGFEVARGL